MSDNLFKDLSGDEINTPVILLVDASGSVKTKFNNTLNIFEKMEQIIKFINTKQFRIIFWNSDKNSIFSDGILSIPYIIPKETLKQTFLLASNKINTSCLTYPHLAFKSIPKEWINDIEPTHIYFLTDGQIGYNTCTNNELNNLKKQLNNNIEDLFKVHNNIHLHIISIESNNIDFNQDEILNIMAGGDVFKIIREEKLIKYVSEFTSYTPNNENGFTHFNNIIAPNGFIPFGNKIFSETKVGEFIEYLKEYIKEYNTENDILRIIQSLSVTIRVLIKDKPHNMCDNIIDTFCGIFNNTIIDSTIIIFLLKDSIKIENQGNIYAEYRKKLTDLYKEAELLLSVNTKKSIGMTDCEFISFPIDNLIVIGNEKLVNESIKLSYILYPYSSVKINEYIIPVISFKTNLTTMNEQCLRHFIRAIIAKQYNQDQYGDIIIYIVLGLVMKVICSDIQDIYKNIYRNIGNIMLKKKRLNTNITELQRLESGELPIPNTGKIEYLYKTMYIVNKILDLNLQPMTLWYAMCLSLQNENLTTKQFIHCKNDIDKDFSNSNHLNILELIKLQIKHVTIKIIPYELMDYTCIITLDDCSDVGGYKLNQHGICKPVFVFSNTGYDSLIKQPNIYCPICYTLITKDSFTKIGPKVNSSIEIGPKVNSSIEIFPLNMINPFSISYSTPKIDVPQIKYTSNYINDNSDTKNFIMQKLSYVICPKANSKKGTLILIRGTVGSGKTMYATKIQQIIENMGGICINEGIDKYCRTGILINQAISLIIQELNKIPTIDNNLLVVIIDTSDENIRSNLIFGYNFSGWNKINVSPNYNHTQNIIQYLSWSLRNVLNRSSIDNNNTYWLNPIDTNISTCINVHHTKAKKLYGKKTPHITHNSKMELVMKDINQNANIYQQYLDEHKNIDMEIQKIITKIC